eukprot:4452692-Pleurochrysis_carterae.AAC.2
MGPKRASFGAELLLEATSAGADYTSYSDMSKPDNRGDALVEVVVNADGTAEVCLANGGVRGGCGGGSGEGGGVGGRGGGRRRGVGGGYGVWRRQGR